MKLKPYTVVGYKDDMGVGRIISIVEHIKAPDVKHALGYFRDDLDIDEEVEVIAIFDGHLYNLPWKT